MSPFPEIARISKILRKLGIAHALIGGWAVNAWGFIRASDDIDLLIDLPPSRKKEILEALSNDYAPQWIDGGQDDPVPAMIRAAPRASGELPTDLIVARSAADRDALSRAVEITAEGATAPYVRVEDLIALKLQAGGGQDYEDVRRLLETNRNDLDPNLLNQACRQRRVLDRLKLVGG